MEAWRPLGGPNSTLRNQPDLLAIAQQHQKQPAQIILRWLYQQQIIPLPKSSNPAHIASNTDIFDFMLSSEEMARLNQLPQGTTAFDPETYHS